MLIAIIYVKNLIVSLKTLVNSTIVLFFNTPLILLGISLSLII